MPTHAEKRHIHHTPEQMFALVADIEKYPEFLPWCVATRIREKGTEDGADKLIADMVIGYKMFREKFGSKVVCHTPQRIDVTYFDGPFKYLTNHWIFEPVEGQGGDCLIDFYVDFEFKSRFFQAAIGPVFNEAVKRMIRAFEKRADALYGNP
ncbi:MAG: type II toxin-antitoxin system RatA family toxin [Alphaproteobacteria bacterium]|jgi:coenzyme Q-binding protein COQ10|nr:type II toxin-antitoxin system RatA family toxin [Alphaproteobacteria bacterium]MBT7944089.1 type II toxin-antitoxin system RatA family toxin [Alphaproteobacteria bacterium]